MQANCFDINTSLVSNVSVVCNEVMFVVDIRSVVFALLSWLAGYIVRYVLVQLCKY